MIELRSLAGGVICAGFDGKHVDQTLATQLKSLELGGVVLFARNIETLDQTRELADELRRVLDEPLIAIDQEGGRVMRLREGVAPIPPMQELAAYGDIEFAVKTGEQIGFDLRRAGVNVNFAPVVDLALFPTNSVIGDRSFGGDPALVTKFGAALAIGMKSHGIVPTFKHFPGHGSTDVDTHFNLPAIDMDEATLRSRDLLPFIALLPGAPAVMTAHIIVRAFDPEQPATLSRRILTGLLREEIGFTGVCFTDCLEMDAIAKTFGTAQGAVRALRAGADCVLVSQHLERAHECIDAIVAAVESGDLARDRLVEAYVRVKGLRTSSC